VRPTIRTAAGRPFSFIDPDSTPLSIEVMAHALSNICRFTGHCREFYSVAQHSVLTSFIVPPQHAMQALGHDLGESVMNDISSPLKRLLPDYKVIEDRCERSIWRSLGLPEVLPPEVKHADAVAYVTERRDLMPEDDPEAWGDEVPDISISHLPPLEERIVPWSPSVSRIRFLHRYYMLLHREKMANVP
jgi:hypothetical protein